MTEVPTLLGGRYEVGALRGRGGMAEVHEGFDTRLGRPVAIKMLRSELARDATFLSRFRREAQSAASLNHAAIAAVYDHGEDHVVTESGGAQFNVPYIIMELVSGSTLREVLDEHGPLEPMEAVRISEGVLDALAYSHRQGIVHRDIKPANVMITESGGVKVMDFGIARAMADASATVTATQAVIGTAQYLSPEQAQGQPVDARSDLYSAGCMLFELITGRPPFLGDSPVAIAYQHVGELPVPPSRFAADTPPEIDAIVLHALEKPRDSRYQDADEFRSDLQAARLGRPVSLAARASAATLEGATVLPAVAGSAAPTEAIQRSRPLPAQDPTASYQPVPAAATPPPPDTSELAPGQERPRRSPAAYIVLGIAVLAALGLLTYGLLNSGDASVETVSVTSVVGQPRQTAEVNLTRDNFVVDAVLAPDDEVAEGIVISQTPAGGAQARPGSTVRITVSSGPGDVQVPSLAGRSKDDAEALLEDLGLSLGTVTEKDDPEAAEGEVISSSPEAGSAVKPGTRVDVVVGTGQVEVPDVVGLSQNEAQRALADANLRVETSFEQTDDAEEGTVLEQDPEGEDTVDIGSTVELVIAQKAAPTVTPTTVSPTPSESPSPTPSPTDGEPSPEPTVPPSP